MIGAPATTDGCLSFSVDPSNALGQEQFLNFGDETQTQAGSIPSMEFTGSSVGPDSLRTLAQTPPVLTTTPMHLHGPAHMSNAIGFATVPQHATHGVELMVNMPAVSAAQHLPGCPSHRHGPQQQPGFPLERSLVQYTDHQNNFQMSNHGWMTGNLLPGQRQSTEQDSRYGTSLPPLSLTAAQLPLHQVKGEPAQAGPKQSSRQPEAHNNPITHHQSPLETHYSPLAPVASSTSILPAKHS